MRGWWTRPERSTGAGLAALTQSAPDLFLISALVGVTAGVATRLGILPGWSQRMLGALAESVLWASLYIGLVLCYRNFAALERRSTRSVLLRLGLALLLALLTTYLCKVLITPLLLPATWTDFFYLRLLLPPVSIAIWCTVLLPRESSAIYVASSDKMLAHLPQLLLLLGSAAVLVSIGDLAFQWREASAVDIRLHRDIVLMNAWFINLLILFAAYLAVFAATARVAAALLIITPLYAGLGLATLAKLEYMHSAVQPLDLIRVAEFIPLFRSFFGGEIIVVLLVALAGWFLALLGRPTIEEEQHLPRASPLTRSAVCHGLVGHCPGIGCWTLPAAAQRAASAHWGSRRSASGDGKKARVFALVSLGASYCLRLGSPRLHPGASDDNSQSVSAIRRPATRASAPSEPDCVCD